MSDLRAFEGQWYADRTTRDRFCVIHVDEIDGLIDVRDSYGDIDEFDFDEWAAMDLELCVPPGLHKVGGDEAGEEDEPPA